MFSWICQNKRERIWEIQIQKHHRDPGDFDVRQLQIWPSRRNRIRLCCRRWARRAVGFPPGPSKPSARERPPRRDSVLLWQSLNPVQRSAFPRGSGGRRPSKSQNAFKRFIATGLLGVFIPTDQLVDRAYNATNRPNRIHDPRPALRGTGAVSSRAVKPAFVSASITATSAHPDPALVWAALVSGVCQHAAL